ncbi:MAG: 6-phosphofructokinase [Ruminococcaceae bacterium]|nr:6-phosphofructokinase [Oscillospiraceae bacterium]
MSQMKNAIVGQSGGPTTAINATLAGVIRGVAKTDQIGTLYGCLNGITGAINDELIDLSASMDDGKLALLKHTPSTYLGSCRYRLDKEEDLARVVETLKKHNIGYFFYIGGNDSMDTISRLTAYAGDSGIQFIGIPKTIDNDLPVTDHCPGYGSAAKYIATSVLEIARDCYCYSTPSVTVVEIMGRHAGWITAASALARTSYSSAPDLIYLPERDFSTERFIADIRQALRRRRNVVVAVSEGIVVPQYDDDCGTRDVFGHRQLGGIGKALTDIVKFYIGCKTRSIEVNVLQRCAAHLASKTDLDESEAIGKAAVQAALAGETGKMMVYVREEPYSVSFDCADINGIANLEKKMPDEFISPDGNDVTAAFINYVTPLVAGEAYPLYENGLPVFLGR